MSKFLQMSANERLDLATDFDFLISQSDSRLLDIISALHSHNQLEGFILAGFTFSAVGGSLVLRLADEFGVAVDSQGQMIIRNTTGATQDFPMPGSQASIYVHLYYKKVSSDQATRRRWNKSLSKEESFSTNTRYTRSFGVYTNTTGFVDSANPNDPDDPGVHNMIQVGIATTNASQVTVWAPTPAQTYLLIDQVKHSGKVGNRVYLDPANGGRVITTNAFFDGTHWNKDVSGTAATKLRVDTSGRTFQVRAAANNTAWADGAWDTEPEFLNAATGVEFLTGVNPGDTTDTTAGNIRYHSSELQIWNGSEWVSFLLPLYQRCFSAQAIAVATNKNYLDASHPIAVSIPFTVPAGYVADVEFYFEGSWISDTGGKDIQTFFVETSPGYSALSLTAGDFTANVGAFPTPVQSIANCGEVSGLAAGNWTFGLQFGHDEANGDHLVTVTGTMNLALHLRKP